MLGSAGLVMNRLASALLALVVLIASGIPGAVAYLCRMDGQVHTDHCCPKDQAELASDGASELRQGDCCELRLSEAGYHAAQAEAASRLLQPAWMVATLPAAPVVVALTSQRWAALPEARGPPDGGETPHWDRAPLFAQNCRYLI